MKQHIHLLAIDPQNDFCDLPPAHRPLDPVSGQPLAPALPVPGAHADMQRLARLVRAGGAGLGGITVTLDSHHRLDIAHPGFWQTGEGGAVAPFTPITAAEVREGRYRTRDPAAQARALAYIDELARRGRYTLMVWPVHCEIGTWGHNLHAELRAACQAWEEARLVNVEMVTKGANPWTEHYSAVQAEVPDQADPGTQLNRALVERLAQAELLLIGGEAGSHCVKATVEHLVEHLGGRLDRVVLLTDCMSPVAGCEAWQAGFLADMAGCGVQLATSDEVLPRLLTNATG